MNDAKCNTCKFFRLNARDMRVGECVRNPPQVSLFPTPNGPMPVSVMPPTKGEDWCGEYQQKVTLAS